jgi:hypothetical protein
MRNRIAKSIPDAIRDWKKALKQTYTLGQALQPPREFIFAGIRG